MLITREHQEAMVEKHKKDNGKLCNTIAFIQGMDAMYELINKKMQSELKTIVD